VTGVWGLGESIVQGKVDPDEFYVHKPTFRAGSRCVLRRTPGGKQRKLVYGEDGASNSTIHTDTPTDDRPRREARHEKAGDCTGLGIAAAVFESNHLRIPGSALHDPQRCGPTQHVGEVAVEADINSCTRSCSPRAVRLRRIT
jgi:hypothetical protein